MFCWLPTHHLRVAAHTLPLFFFLDRYDYWAKPSSRDLRPIGWCQLNEHPLQAPKNYTFGAFTWESFLAREGAEAVPASLLTGSSSGVAEAAQSRQSALLVRAYLSAAPSCTRANLRLVR